MSARTGAGYKYILDTRLQFCIVTRTYVHGETLAHVMLHIYKYACKRHCWSQALRLRPDEEMVVRVRTFSIGCGYRAGNMYLKSTDYYIYGGTEENLQVEPNWTRKS